MKVKIIDPAELIQRVLNLMDREISKIEKTDELTDLQLKLLPDFLRIILATQKNKMTEEKELSTNYALLTTEELEAELKKAQAK